MNWFLRLMFGENDLVWVNARIIRKTEKAILVDIGKKIWIAKSQIREIRLRKNTFEIKIKLLPAQ